MRILFFLACLVLATAAQAEHIKIGVLKTTASAPIFIASAKDYFAAEGLDAELVFFESAQPIAVAVASGAIDVGNAGFTGGFYGLVGDGALRIISGGASEVTGYHNQAFLASNKAWDAGLRSLKHMPGHSFAVSQIGSPPHYAMGIAAQKYGFDPQIVSYPAAAIDPCDRSGAHRRSGRCERRDGKSGRRHSRAWRRQTPGLYGR
jgi:NitT/TauT family transport system substrate-binding protein